MTQLRCVLQLFPPLHLLHQEGGRHRRIVLRIDRGATQFAEIRGTLERIPQALIRLIDANRPLHGHALGGRALRGKAVRMRLSLKVLPACVEHRRVLRKLPA
jgi:hypothetical protein